MPHMEGQPWAHRYTLGAALGSGGYGDVRRAVDGVSGDEVAIKIARRSTTADALRSARETAALRQLDIPGVVRLRDEGVFEDQHYIVMDLIDGAIWPGRPAPVPWSELRATAEGLVQTLGRVHRQGIIHRDLKPSNVMVSPGGAPTLLDFGLSRGHGLGSTITQHLQQLGTPRYMAPEQFRGERADQRADLYSLGAMLFEALSGSPPRDDATCREALHTRRCPPAPSLRQSAPWVDAHVIALVDQLLESAPAVRHDSAEDVLAAMASGMTRPAYEIPWLGDSSRIERAMAALLRGASFGVCAESGGGTSRFVSEVVIRLRAAGRTVRFAVPVASGQRVPPYSSLRPFVGELALDGLELSAVHDRVLAAVLARVEVDTIVAVDSWQRVDRRSQRVLSEVMRQRPVLFGTTEPLPGAVPLEPLSAREMEPLFCGPNRNWFLQTDAAAELCRRSRGNPGRMTRELAGWVLDGLATWERGRLRCHRADIDRLAEGLGVTTVCEPSARQLLEMAATQPPADSSHDDAAHDDAAHDDALQDDALTPRLETGDTLPPAPAPSPTPQNTPRRGECPDDPVLAAWIAVAGRNATLPVLARALRVSEWTLEAQLEDLIDRGWVQYTADERLVVQRHRVAPWVWTPAELVEVHCALAEALPPKTPGRLAHWVVCGRADRIMDEARHLAAEHFEWGRLSQACAVAEEGLRAMAREWGAETALARTPNPGLYEVADELADILTVAACHSHAESIRDRADNVLRASPLSHRWQSHRHMIPATTAVATGGWQGVRAVVDALAPFRHEQLESWRHAVRVRAVLNEGPASAWEELFAELDAWAATGPEPRRAELHRWRAWTAYLWRSGQGALENHQAEAKYLPGPLHRRTVLHYNLANCALDRFQFDIAEQSATEGMRLASRARDGVMCVYFDAMLRKIPYRRGDNPEPCEEIIESARWSNHKDLLATVLLSEAAMAWRAGDEGTAATWALEAATLWEGEGRREAGTLARAFAHKLDSAIAPNSAERVKSVIDDESAQLDIRLQICVLSQSASASAPAGLADPFERRPELSRDHWRFDVLSIGEVRGLGE